MYNKIYFPFSICNVIFCGLFLCNTVFAEPAFDVVNNGPSENRIDVVYLGDGYTESEMGKFKSDVEEINREFFEYQPFSEYQSYFNVRRIEVVSNESGADKPREDIYRDTALDGLFNCNDRDRAICIDRTKARRIISNSVEADEADIIVVLVNDTQYGGLGGGGIAVASMNNWAAEMVVHEIGHSFGYLADEYDYGRACGTTVEPFQPNVTMETERGSIKWNHWIDATTPVPTYEATYSLTGLYEGAKYCTSNVFRPTYDSLMRSLRRQFGPVNEEILIKRIYSEVSPLDTYTPANDTLSLTSADTEQFSVAVLNTVSAAVSVEWYLDNESVGTGLSYSLDASLLGDGSYTLTALVVDATSRVRSDPQQLLEDAVSWQIQVNGEPGQPQVCFDPDGDGWGWNGVESCRVETVDEELACFDPDGDGWGWNGVESCRVTTTVEPQLTCLDPDGDGWGWNGVESCRVSGDDPQVDDPKPETGVCVDLDGDGWGWNGSNSCQMTNVVTAVGSATCNDPDGDGWGWNGLKSCRP